MFDLTKGHGFEVDYWAIGVILFYMLYAEYPFDSESEDVEKIYKLIQESEPEYDYEKVSENANDLIKWEHCKWIIDRSLLVKDPSKRAGYQELMESAFICKECVPEIKMTQIDSKSVEKSLQEKTVSLILTSNANKNVYDKQVSNNFVQDSLFQIVDYDYVKFFVNFQKVRKNKLTREIWCGLRVEQWLHWNSF